MAAQVAMRKSVVADATNVESRSIELMAASPQLSPELTSPNLETKKEGPDRCACCSKRVGLTGFKCKCGILFCSIHRYSDKHDCPFDYRTAARDAIAKANPLVKAEKFDKI